MARSTPVKKAWRSLTWLAVIIVGLIAINGAGVLFGGGSWAPKLALDLEGGTQIRLAPKLESGETVSQEQLDQAVSIIRQRIDASGVSEAEISTEGAQNIIVSIPGTPDDETLRRIEASAKLEFRPVIYTDVAAVSTVRRARRRLPVPDARGCRRPNRGTDGCQRPELGDATRCFAEFQNFDCAALDQANTNVAPADEPLITCEDDGSYKYILGPVEVSGETISDATSGLITNSQGVSTGQWGVFITFNDEGTTQFASVTERLFGFPDTDPRNRFAIVLDGRVISAPTTQGIITDGKPQISGSFTQESAKTLADQLKFGALPIGFTVQSSTKSSRRPSDRPSCRAGSSPASSASSWSSSTRCSSTGCSDSVTVASLVIAAMLTYLVIVILSWRQGYRLSLAGVAGLIVAIGFTADSFIVYFERIRDELRDGRGLESAVEAGWKRALRTIFAAKAVNLLSAVVLFLLAVGNVQGFALTLGITTVIDVLVVVLFTHPMLQLLATTQFFSSGHPLSGLDPKALGAVYRGRAQFRAPVSSWASGTERTARRRVARRSPNARRPSSTAGPLPRRMEGSNDG